MRDEFWEKFFQSSRMKKATRTDDEKRALLKKAAKSVQKATRTDNEKRALLKLSAKSVQKNASLKMKMEYEKEMQGEDRAVWGAKKFLHGLKERKTERALVLIRKANQKKCEEIMERKEKRKMDKKSKKETGNNEEPQTVNTAKKTVKERLDDLLKKEDMEEKAVTFREGKDETREKVKKTTVKERLEDLLEKEDMEEKAVAFRERKDPKREKVKKTATLKEKKRE